MAYFLTIGGLALLGIGGEALVRAAANLANRLRVSRLLVGLLVIALATSSPELAVAIGAALGGYPDIAVGNVVGSNIANILLVLSLGVLIFPMSCCQHVKERDLVVVLAVTGFFVWLSAKRGEINAMYGGLKVVMLLLYAL